MLVPIAIPETVQQYDPDSPVHRIFCIDCSGSMFPSLQEIRTQLKNKIPTSIRPQDFMTLIWFSGRNEVGTIFEHISINDLPSLNKVNTAIDRYLKPVGSTGFVEPIKMAKELAEKYPETPQVFFLSDGGENVWPKDECEQAFSDMKNIPLVIVEYQYYCDRAFLQHLAEVSNAVSIFNEDFNDYNDSFIIFMKNTVSNNIFHQIKTDHPIIYMHDENLVIKKPVNGHVRLSSDIKEGWEVLDNNDDSDRPVKLVYMEMLYAIHTKSLKQMSNLVALLGDVHITKRYSVCFSKQDFSRLAEHIKKCILNPETYSFVDGCDKNNKVKDDAFNVIQLLQLLQQDDKTRFYPYHPSFSYKRISKEVNDETHFVANRDLGSKINLVFNQSRANISIGCEVHGHKIVDDEISPSIAFRNYTILKDGIKNVNIIPVSLSEPTFNTILAEGLIKETDYQKNNVYLLDMTNLPVVNRLFVSVPFTSTDFCQKHVEMYYTKSESKYLKKMLDNMKVKEEEKEEKEYERKKADPNVVRDFYDAPDLQVKISKCSTIPPINDKLLAKLDAKTKLTPSEAVLVAIHEEYKGIPSETKEEWLQHKIQSQKTKLYELTTYLEQAKMALLIGNAWFSDCNEDKKTFLVLFQEKESEVSIEINNIKVYMD